jgi:hypothetical protein
VIAEGSEMEKSTVSARRGRGRSRSLVTRKPGSFFPISRGKETVDFPDFPQDRPRTLLNFFTPSSTRDEGGTLGAVMRGRGPKPP